MVFSIFSQHKLRQFLARIKRKPSYVLIPIVILSLFVIVGAFGPLLAPHSPTVTNLSLRYQPPFWSAGGNWEYPLGTDALGRDILSRVIFGARVSLTFALLAIAVGGSIGTLLGLVAGYYGSWIDAVIMRLVDLAMSIPFLLLAMVFVVIFGPSLMNLVIIVSLLIWAFYARQVRGETLSIKEQNFVALARISGCSTPRIIARHIFPNVLPTLIVLATLQVGWIILMEASLSFLGVGIPPPAPAWGSMVADGRPVLDVAWWISLFPGLCIGAVVLSLNLFGDWLRDTLDPRLRQV
jgi:peptide/nickel transport system permease protein